jgi:hypothetical protein
MRLQAGFLDFEADICPCSRVTNSRYQPLLLRDQTTYMIRGIQGNAHNQQNQNWPQPRSMAVSSNSVPSFMRAFSASAFPALTGYHQSIRLRRMANCSR